jgi:hypothetical protein
VTTPINWTDPNPRDATDPRAKTAVTIAGVALTTLVVAALIFVVVAKHNNMFGGGSPEQTVVLAPANAPVSNPFTPSVVVSPTRTSVTTAATLAAATQQFPIAADRGVRLASGTQPGLYGATVQGIPCDASAVANHLDAHPEKAGPWAQAMGLPPAQIPYYLNTLTPVVLTADTWVTSHAFSAGQASAFQTVLQAGSAIMIDPVGIPRVHCASGDPLRPPANKNLSVLSDIEGRAWSGYDPQNVVAVAYSSSGSSPPQSAPITEFSLVDLGTGEPLVRKAGGTINLGPITGQYGQLPDPVSMNIPPAADAEG